MSAILCCWLALFPAQGAAEVVAAIQVHGNHVTAADEVIRLSGLAVGDAVSATTPSDARLRLRQTGRFRDVEVLKRYASIADSTQIVIVIIVNEGPVRLEVPEDPALPIRVVRGRRLGNVMVMPILFGEDGYGLTAGVRLAYVGVTGERGRLSFPLTIGGERRAAVEFDRPFGAGSLTRVQAGVSTVRSRHPAFDLDDRRTRTWARLERSTGPVRFGAVADWQRVSFGGQQDEVRSAGLDVTLDTRRDPVLARNAVFVFAAWSRRHFQTADDVNQWRLEGRGYAGLVGQSVLVVRALHQDAGGQVPDAFTSVLGGSANLRGFRAGTGAGDTLSAGSLELRLPLSSPLSVGRLGVSVFADAGAVYPDGNQIRDQKFRSGFGGGVWLAATAFHVAVSAARGRGAGTRVHFSAGVGQ